jgi:hypothetical protein
MCAQTEEAVVKVKMVLGVRSGTSIIMNRLCTVVTLVMNKSCTFSHHITNHAIVIIATSKLHVLIYSALGKESTECLRIYGISILGASDLMALLVVM